MSSEIANTMCITDGTDGMENVFFHSLSSVAAFENRSRLLSECSQAVNSRSKSCSVYEASRPDFLFFFNVPPFRTQCGSVDLEHINSALILKFTAAITLGVGVKKKRQAVNFTLILTFH